MISSLLLQLRGAVPTTPWELISSATPLTKAVLVLLALLSLLSWSIMFSLWRELGKAVRSTEQFFREFERTTRLEEAGSLAKMSPPNALTRLFMHAMRFVSDTRVTNQQVRERATPISSAPASDERITRRHSASDCGGVSGMGCAGPAASQRLSSQLA